LRIIREVEEGGLLDETIDRHFSSPTVPARYKPLIYEVASGVIRWRLYLDWVLSHFVKEGLKRDVRLLLRMGLYQVFFMKKAAYHVVDETVDHAKAEKGKGVANFVNAVLRRSISERESLSPPRDPVSRLSITYSFPRWLVARWYGRFGADGTEELLRIANTSPEFTVRINAAKTTREEVTERLAREGIKARKGRLLDAALTVDRIGPVLDSGLVKEGLVHVQDESSQMAGLALALRPHTLVLDACAGRGTKTAQIREQWPSCRVAAMDLSGRRLAGLRGATCRVQGDVLKNPFKKGRLDSILLDAPCSSLGIIRKHPEIKWRRGERDVSAFGDLQGEMIRSLHGGLREGGHLVYSVCSFEPEETTDVIEKVRKEGLFGLERPLPMLLHDEYFLSLPHVSGMDGFFIARLRKL
jgi:16S rRNA (cytosine967-C5)-methyltransferase